MILNYDPDGLSMDTGERMKLERLKLAISCKQKTVSMSFTLMRRIFQEKSGEYHRPPIIEIDRHYRHFNIV